jgi:hypothetical protein
MAMAQHSHNSSNIPAAIVHLNSSMQTATAHYHHSSHIQPVAALCSLNILLATPYHSNSIPMGQAGHQCPLDSMGHLCISRDEKSECENLM